MQSSKEEQGEVRKPSSAINAKKKKFKKAERLSEEALQMAEERREVKREKRKDNTQLNAEFENSKER